LSPVIPKFVEVSSPFTYAIDVMEALTPDLRQEYDAFAAFMTEVGVLEYFRCPTVYLKKDTINYDLSWTVAFNTINNGNRLIFTVHHTGVPPKYQWRIGASFRLSHAVGHKRITTDLVGDECEPTFRGVVELLLKKITDTVEGEYSTDPGFHSELLETYWRLRFGL
jgi:hypothetical protein